MFPHTKVSYRMDGTLLRKLRIRAVGLVDLRYAFFRRPIRLIIVSSCSCFQYTTFPLFYLLLYFHNVCGTKTQQACERRRQTSCSTASSKLRSTIQHRISGLLKGAYESIEVLPHGSRHAYGPTQHELQVPVMYRTG